ncbi:hypothetical protein EON63_17810 [archaeon]|nr:MAG: hypothetical protein EON63_17810 [archaeon]
MRIWTVAFENRNGTYLEAREAGERVNLVVFALWRVGQEVLPDLLHRFIESERKFTEEKVRSVIAFKRQVCKDNETFCVINQKGIDPFALDMLAKEGIMALRRAKRRNMER